MIRNSKAEQARRAGKRPQDIKLKKHDPADDSEADIQRKIIALLKRRGAIVTRVNSGKITIPNSSNPQDVRRVNLAAPGTSDLICLYQGRYLALEIKRPGNQPTTKQQEFLEDVRRAGGIGMVLTSTAECEALLDAIKG